MTHTEKALLQTFAYNDIFRFSLTKDELWKFLISDKKLSKNEFDLGLKNLSKKIISQNGFYAMAERTEDIQRRKESLREVQKKLRIAKRAAYYLSYIPTISLIGISGGVAMGKADPADDIDFFIITRKNTLFMTRLWVQAMLEMLDLRRKRDESEAQDKICVNLLIDETRLTWPKEERDVYTAHEIAQMQPLFERNEMYQQFIAHNDWVESIFPNAFEKKPQIIGHMWNRNYLSLKAFSAMVNHRPFEAFVRRLQKQHMKRYKTTEIVNNKVLAFHPVDYRTKTLDSLNMKLQHLGLLTNK